MKYLIDTYGWIEYFLGSEQGEQVKKIVDDERNKIIVSDATFAELYCWAVREEHIPGQLLALVRKKSEVFAIYTNIWIEAAHRKMELREKHKEFGLIDALLLAIQNVTKATIVTGDPHFKGLKNVMML